MSPYPSILLAGLALALAGWQATPQSAEDVAAALQRKYDTIRDFSADFTQEHVGVLRRKRVERGTLLVKKPGKMRWQYTSPEEKLFVSDGIQLYSYLPAENRVLVSPMPQDDQAATGILFLAGKGHLTRDFKVSFADGAPADGWALRLEPKRPQSEYDWLEIVAAKDTLRIRALVVADKQGRSTYLLSNFKENPGLADKMFNFTPPRGVEVIYAGPAKR
jgi:outer membrane lipoprotein carrier protein